MEPRAFGKTGLKVSALGFGTGHVGSPDQDEKDIERLLNTVLDEGITLLDTARGYGLAEERLGRMLRHRRDEFVLVSKCGYDVEGTEDWTPECISKGIDDALQRLKTDRIDVMLFHSCPKEVLDRPGLIDALLSAVEQGKVRVAGYSGENEALEHALSLKCFGAIETSVNPFDQLSLREYIQEAAGQGLGVIAKRPLGNAPWRFDERPEGHYCEVYWDRMQAMQLDPGAHDWDELSLRFSAFAPGVSCAIAGTSSIDHLKHNVEIVRKGPLPNSEVRQIREIFDRHDGNWTGQI